jgi:Domain of unknown function (DUF6766)
VRRFLRENSLSIFFGILFLASIVAQSIAGWKDFNEELLAHDDAPITYGRYLYSSEFGAALMENWQSEFLQFFFYIAATIWFLQKGSNESKKLNEAGLESDEQQRVGKWAGQSSPKLARSKGFLHSLYANSLLLVMGTIFLASWFAESVTAWTVFNADQLDHEESAVGWSKYLTTPDFWEKSLQNWQSEFLAVGTMAVFTIYLRQRGSPESKPVGAPHDETGSSG